MTVGRVAFMVVAGRAGMALTLLHTAREAVTAARAAVVVAVRLKVGVAPCVEGVSTGKLASRGIGESDLADGAQIALLFGFLLDAAAAGGAGVDR